jgi:4-hydroxybenzoate polyprenyltransferase
MLTAVTSSARPREGVPAGVSALLRASHPAPTVAVTVFVIVLLAAAGNTVLSCLIGALAVLCGQASIGWSNDLIDAGRDRAARRADKPLAVGALPRSWLLRGSAAALVLCVPLSLALGWRAGVAHLIAVACGWLYNLGWKATITSAVPYLIAFGLLPAIATLAASGHRWAPWWAVASAALLGMAAHLGNVLPDLTEDRMTGVRGLPHRLGGTGSALTASVSVVAASVLVLLGPHRAAGPLDYLGLAAVLALAAICVLGYRRNPTSEAAFYATMAAAAVDLALIALSGGLH